MAVTGAGAGRGGAARGTAMRLSMRVWDLPVRLFHWLLTGLLAAAWATQHWHRIGWHIRIGEVLLALLVWRITWGIVGSDTARFRSFVVSPALGLAHLARLGRRESDDQIGHNAAGGWWVLVMLALVAVQIVSGLTNSWDYTKGGPLYHLLPPAAAHVMAQVHGIAFWVLLGTIGVHVLVIAAYAGLKGQDLLRPMISGKKRMPAAMRAPRMASPVLALLVLLCAAGAVLLLLNGLAR